jgi:hypothetical protein
MECEVLLLMVGLGTMDVSPLDLVCTDENVDRGTSMVTSGNQTKRELSWDNLITQN